MISSMTGYGSAEGQLKGAAYAVEIRAVNNRYFKARIKLPDSVTFLEEGIEKLLQKELLRGMVNYVLRIKNASAAALFDIDETALRTAAERLGQIAGCFNNTCKVDLGYLLTLPGIVQPALADDKTAPAIKEVVLRTTQEALVPLKQMRSAEGAALEKDMEKRCRAIKEDLQQIRGRSTASLKEYREKLRKKVDALLADVQTKLDETTLVREVAVLAEKSDISEELARLESHLQQFDETCTNNEQAGRRLDFISQEMLREANTIASKSCDIEITRAIVDMKCQIDRIKEQVQNVK